MQSAPQHFGQSFRHFAFWSKCSDQLREGSTESCRRFLAGEFDLRRQDEHRLVDNRPRTGKIKIGGTDVPQNVRSRAARAERLNRLRRPAFLLSGLLTCGCCGTRYGIVVNDRYGCLGHFRKGNCENGRTIRRNDIERRVLAGLTDKLVSPEAVAVAVRAYVEETNRQNHERRAQTETSRRALEKIDRGIKGIIDAIEDGMYQPAMKARMSELEQQKAEIEARLAEAPADIPDVHPNIAEHYRAKVIRLAETLAEPESNGEAREDIRSIIGEVVITPGEKRGENHATLRGELMAILDFAAGRRISPKPEVITNALAGPRNHFCYNSPPSGLASGTGLSFWNWRRRAVALLQATVRATISVAMTRPALFAR
jgi:hypothetical protein